jgi:hypothetical protein
MLTGREPDASVDAERDGCDAEQFILHFQHLGCDAQATAVRRLAACGFSDGAIAAKTGLAKEDVRRILGGIR